MDPENTSRLLPWTNPELKELLKDLIAHGTEAAKADYKAELMLDTQDQKAEFLKDVSAIANTVSDVYADYGFLIYGVSGKAITGTTTTERNTDSLQNTIEQLVKTYLAPMVQLYVIGFTETGGQEWGVIVVTPNNNKPYMFMKDMQCQDPKRSRKRGEWFVRRGATTDPGLPEDLMMITQRQFAASIDPLKDSIRSLQGRIARMEDEYRSGMIAVIERALSGGVGGTPQGSGDGTSVAEDILQYDLPSRLKQRLQTPSDKIADELIAEAMSLRGFLEGTKTGLPWAPQLNNPEESRRLVELLEEKTRTLQVSIATILLNDSKNTYTEALMRVIKIMARTTDAPMGVQFNRLGPAIRYYPLGIILYTVFVCGVAANRASVLKQVLKTPLVQRQRNERVSILSVAYYWYEARELFNEAMGQRLCEPIPQRIRQIMSDAIGDQLAEGAEAEVFFRGEFVMALAGIDAGVWDKDIPLPGLYLYLDEAHRAVEDFLEDHPSWFETLYNRPVEEILALFEKNAGKVVKQGCMALGLSGLKILEAYVKAA
jgi:hypothetical protein